MSEARRVHRRCSEPVGATDELQPLPPLDDGADGEGPIEAPLDLRVFADDDAADADDSVAHDLDIGIRLPDLDAPAAEDLGETAVGGIDGLVALVPESDESSGDDRMGPHGADDGALLAELPALGEGTGEGTSEGLEGLVSDELPELDADRDGDANDEDLGAWGDAVSVVDDEPAPAAAIPWVWSLVSDVPAAALAATPDTLWIGGSAVRAVALADREPLPSVLAETATPWISIAPIDEGLLGADAVGRLYTLLRGGDPQPVDDWRAAFDLASDAPDALSVVGSDRGIVARTASGRLGRADRAGRDWQPIDVPLVRALAADAERGWIAVSGAPSPALHVSRDGVAWTIEPIGADPWTTEKNPLLGAAGRIVALGSRHHGVALRANARSDFERVAGTVGAVALALHDGAPPLLFVAVARETRGVTEILRVDVSTGSAERIVEVPSAAEDGSAVQALVFDSGTKRLWIAGDFGLAYATPPEDETR